jgi:hypothetical protein
LLLARVRSRARAALPSVIDILSSLVILAQTPSVSPKFPSVSVAQVPSISIAQVTFISIAQVPVSGTFPPPARHSPPLKSPSRGRSHPQRASPLRSSPRLSLLLKSPSRGRSHRQRAIPLRSSPRPGDVPTRSVPLPSAQVPVCLCCSSPRPGDVPIRSVPLPSAQVPVSGTFFPPLARFCPMAAGAATETRRGRPASSRIRSVVSRAEMSTVATPLPGWVLAPTK